MRGKLLSAALTASACLVVSVVPAEAGPAVTGDTADASVVTTWNEIADRTIFTENAKTISESGLYFGFVHLAMYDAVVAIRGGYQPYAYHRVADPAASPEAAAVTAAYDVLRHYFPASATNLAADYADSMAAIPNGRAKIRGRLVGTSAAATLIRVRLGDGRNADITLDVEPAPGVWRPTPPAFAPMIVPWLGFVDPLVLASDTQLQGRHPDALDSAAYARDYAEVRAYGAREGSLRTQAQTDTALFYTDNAVRQYQTALRAQVTDRGLGLLDSARAFALLGSATADAEISCWRSKYDYAYWRPITAITLGDTDGNPATTADPIWLPLVDTPPYPEYTSGHACITGAATGTFSYLFGADAIDLDVYSAVAGASRHYDTAGALDTQTMNARIWLGLHFRKAMTDGNRQGHRSADWASTHAFQPTG